MKLISEINKLKNSDAGRVIADRMSEFKSNKNHFSELCFCLMTANFNAQRCIKIQDALGDVFCQLPQQELAGELRKAGHRFPNARAHYITEARSHKDSLVLERDWLVSNIKGLGMKEASHFLRNIGFTDYAIIDFHIIDLLVKHGLIERPKTLNKSKYLEIEGVLRDLGRQTNLSLAELDLCLWYLETGKILK